jgi:hypothetical protein
MRISGIPTHELQGPPDSGLRTARIALPFGQIGNALPDRLIVERRMRFAVHGKF